jgi:hypothetical protein
VPIVIILAAIAILGGIVVVAMGRGGELARAAEELPSIADFESGTDVARYRPPPALLGYDPGATEYAFLQAGRALADRDAEIARLRGRLLELDPDTQDRRLPPTPGRSPHDAGGDPEVSVTAESIAPAGPGARNEEA